MSNDYANLMMENVRLREERREIEIRLAAHMLRVTDALHALDSGRIQEGIEILAGYKPRSIRRKDK